MSSKSTASLSEDPEFRIFLPVKLDVLFHCLTDLTVPEIHKESKELPQVDGPVF